MSIILRPLCAVFLLPVCMTGLWAAPPTLQTPSPVIYLADNLDENQMLGYCIDTVGRGLSNRLHAHSCKPRGGDVQFVFDAPTGRLASHTFAGKCAQVPANKTGDILALVDCAEVPTQRFRHDQDKGEIQLGDDPALCLTVGAASRQAGPFMARDLRLASCDATPPALKQWVILP